MTKDDSVATANALYRSGAYSEALVLYEDIANRRGWEPLVRANIALCKRRLLQSAGGQIANTALSPSQPSEIAVTLTTIRSRLLHVPRVVESLLTQTLRPVRIDLNISRDPYLLDAGIVDDDPVVVELKELPLVRVQWVPNIGPYRKIWPFMEEHFSQEIAQDRVFITVDDDTLYPDYFIERLYESYLLHDCVIAFRGRHIELNENGVTPYEQWTWGRVQPSLSNMPTGKDGILYSTKFFTRDFLNMKEAKRMAPTADDLWIKWHCALNGVPAVILNPEACTSDYKSFPVVSYDEAYRGNSLYKQHNATRAQNKNDTSVDKLEAHFNQAYGYNLAWLIAAESGWKI
jgi:hypothetical protein